MWKVVIAAEKNWGFPRVADDSYVDWRDELVFRMAPVRSPFGAGTRCA